MQYILAAAVFMLMVSVGMSIHASEIIDNWRKLSSSNWMRLLLATFVIPPIIALVISWALGLNLASTTGIFMVAAAPGAPLMTRGVGKRGFDMQLAASYQVWGALMTPIMIPLMVGLAGMWFNRDIWIDPLILITQIAKQQFLPLILGMLLMKFIPDFSKKIQRYFNLAGNILLILIMVGALVKLGPKLLSINPLLPLAAILLAVGSILAIRLLGWSLRATNVSAEQTLSICNANRHIGLAMLMTKQILEITAAVPAVACYAIAAPIVMILYAKLLKRHLTEEQAATA
jgi:BASS family bile acid:Na+ symporter